MSNVVESRPPWFAGPARWIVFVAVVCVAVVLAAAGIWAAREERDSQIDAAETVPTVAPGSGSAAATLTGDAPMLLFRNTALADSFGRLAVAPADDPTGPRIITDLSCERAHIQSEVGVCLEADRGFITTYRALVFDESFSIVHEIGLAGTPSRVRVSPSGTRAGATVFVSGHSYADTGFSTQTVILDTVAGDVLADLEVDFTVRRNGDVFDELDFNFWGVTFIDDNEFFATLGSGGEAYLVRGDIDRREIEVVERGVECPSLSPSGTHIAFKSGGVGVWQIAVMELATSEVTVVAETRSVDDQVAWLDDDTLMYGLATVDSPAETDMWLVPADGSGEPKLFVPKAWSVSIAG
nr:hypothetical protein [uncultured bacterium]